VRVGLVTHVPDDAVFRRVEHIVQRHREFDSAQVGAQVSAGLGHVVQHTLAHFIGHLRQLRAAQATQIGRGLEGFKQA